MTRLRASFLTCLTTSFSTLFLASVCALIGSVFHHQHHAKVRAHSKGLRKQIEHDFGPGTGCYVIIVRRVAKQQIAHAASGQIGRKARSPQTRHNRTGGTERRRVGQRTRHDEGNSLPL